MPRKAAVAVVEEPEEVDENADLQAEVVRLRDEEEKNWKEIAEELEISQGRVILLHMKATVLPEDLVKWTDEDDLGKKIVSMRDDDQLSWGVIGVRCQVPESKVRRLYLDTSGISSIGLRIGKGGRYPASENGESNGAATPRVSKPSKKAAAGEASSSAGAVALPNPKEVPFSQWTLAQLKTRFNGKKVVFNQGGKQESKVVKNVMKIADGEMTFTDSDGGRRTIVTTEIKSVGR